MVVLEERRSCAQSSRQFMELEGRLECTHMHCTGAPIGEPDALFSCSQKAPPLSAGQTSKPVPARPLAHELFKESNDFPIALDGSMAN